MIESYHWIDHSGVITSSYMKRPSRLVIVAVLLTFAVVFTALTVSSYVRESATVDEPQHLTAGYIALKLSDYHVDAEHPPFLRMWAALPLLMMQQINLDTDSVNWLPMKPEYFSHEFLYLKNNADRLLYPARFMIVLLGILLGGILFCWAQKLYGFWPAVIVLALYTTEPNILAHARLVTTDFGITCFMFATLYFVWRTTRELTLKNLSGLIVFCALAQVSKFSALILWPIMFVLLLVHVLRGNTWLCRIGPQRELTSRIRKMLAAACIGVLLLLASFTAIWAVYGFRYSPAPEGSRLLKLVNKPVVLERVPRLAKVMNWINDHHLLPNACTQGFLLSQGLSQKRAAFLAGRVSDTGWWYYFPVVFLIKTPISTLVLLFGGTLLALFKRKVFMGDDSFMLAPVVVYLLIAMTSHLNIGLRHILPIYPFVLLIAGRAVAWLWENQQKMLRAWLLALCLFQIDETAFVYPHYLAFFNQFIGGPRNGYKWLADSNIDWGQDLKPLKKWMDHHDIKAVNLSYFGHADPAYYGIKCSYPPPVPFFAEGRDDGLRLPGYVAVSVQNLRGLSVDPPRPDLYKKLLESEPVAVIGYSIHVYWVDRPWW